MGYSGLIPVGYSVSYSGTTRHAGAVHVTELWLYPVKSLGGVSPIEAEVEPWGLRGDRRFAVILPDGGKLNAQRGTGLLRITAEPLMTGGVLLRDVSD